MYKHTYTKKEAIKIVTECASKYAQLFSNKNYLLIYRNKNKRVFAIEVQFEPRHFLHLTGLKLNKEKDRWGNIHEITAVRFLKKCLSHQLKEKDFEFSDDGTTHLKLDVLPSLMKKGLSANMIADNTSYTVKLYTSKLVGNTVACIGFILDKDDVFVPNTVLKNDIRDIGTDICQIIAIFRKDVSRSAYIEHVYSAKNIVWEELSFPEPYNYLKEYFV